jgi:ABC-type amino acid transport substrate-binding protein
MRKTLLAALAAPLLVAACSTGAAAPAPTVTVTETEERVIPAPEPDEPERDIVGDDATYLAFLASKGVVADSDTSIEVGKQVCEALDKGFSVIVLMEVAKDAGFTTEQSAAIIAAAIVTYCPWNESKVG